jgi:hypothetical protein
MHMDEAIRDSIITDSYGRLVISRSYSVDDGDGHYDEMSDDMEIKFCPFCGKKLE